MCVSKTVQVKLLEFSVGQIFGLTSNKSAIVGLAREFQTNLNLGFGEFPKQVFEAVFSFLVTVWHQQNTVVGELAGEAGEFFELLGGDFIAAESDVGDLKFIESHDVVHAFDDDKAVSVEGFFDPRFLKSRGVASVEFETLVVAFSLRMGWRKSRSLTLRSHFVNCFIRRLRIAMTQTRMMTRRRERHLQAGIRRVEFPF